MSNNSKGQARKGKKYDRPVDFLPYIPVTTDEETNEPRKGPSNRTYSTIKTYGQRDANNSNAFNISNNMRTYDRLLSDETFVWTSMDNRANEDTHATIPEMLSHIPTSYGNHLKKVPKVPKKAWIQEYKNYVPRKYQMKQQPILTESSDESDKEENQIPLKGPHILKSAFADNVSDNMAEPINMEEQFLCEALFASEIEVRRKEGLKDPADWCMDEASTASISCLHHQVPSSSTNSNFQLSSSSTSSNYPSHQRTSSSISNNTHPHYQVPSSFNNSNHQLPSSSTSNNDPNYQLSSSSTSNHLHNQLRSSSTNSNKSSSSTSSSGSQYPILFEQSRLTNSSDVGLLIDDEQLDTADIAQFDAEYLESAAPQIVLDENVAPSTNQTRKLNSYARQTLGNEQWDWDGFEVVYVNRKGYCIRATRDLYPGYRFPYGGAIISILEGQAYRRKPNNLLFGRGLHEYLVAYHREWTNQKSGKKFRQRCYLDGHPRHLEMEGGLPFAWPGIYCSQADEYEDINAELAELSTRHQPPHYENVDPSIRMYVVVKKKIKAGDLVEIDYRMSNISQIRRKFGPAYQEFLRKNPIRSHKAKMFRKRRTMNESENVSSNNYRRQIRNSPALKKQNPGKNHLVEAVHPLLTSKPPSSTSLPPPSPKILSSQLPTPSSPPLPPQTNKILASPPRLPPPPFAPPTSTTGGHAHHLLHNRQQQIFEHPIQDSVGEPKQESIAAQYRKTIEPFAITKWLEGTEFVPNHEQRERMRYQYPFLAEDLRSARNEIMKFQKAVAKASKNKKERKKVDDNDKHHEASEGEKKKK